MSEETKNLGLVLTPAVTPETFKNWRLNMNGTNNSNFKKIDDKIGDIDELIDSEITARQAGDEKYSKHVSGIADRHKAADIDYADGVTVKAQIDSKANQQNANGGFNGGSESSAAQGGTAGYKTTANNGFAGGNLATTQNGSATGASATSRYGGAAGANSYTYHGGAVGSNAKSGNGFSGGNSATVKNNGTDDNPSYIDAIQLGTGTNNTPKTMQIYNKRIVDADGSLTDVGSLNGLKTSGKDSIVQAINELTDEKLTVQFVTVSTDPLTSNSLDNCVGTFAKSGQQTAKQGDYTAYIIHYRNFFTAGDDYYEDSYVGILIASYFYMNDSNNKTEGVNQLYIEPSGRTFQRAITREANNYSNADGWSKWKQMNTSPSEVQSSILAYAGDKENLNTENKTTLVNAINELFSKCKDINADTLLVGLDGVTTDKKVVVLDDTGGSIAFLSGTAPEGVNFAEAVTNGFTPSPALTEVDASGIYITEQMGAVYLLSRDNMNIDANNSVNVSGDEINMVSDSRGKIVIGDKLDNSETDSPVVGMVSYNRDLGLYSGGEIKLKASNMGSGDTTINIGKNIEIKPVSSINIKSGDTINISTQKGAVYVNSELQTKDIKGIGGTYVIKNFAQLRLGKNAHADSDLTDVDTNPVMISVGNGTDSDNRGEAMTLLKNGDVTFSGNVYAKNINLPDIYFELSGSITGLSSNGIDGTTGNYEYIYNIPAVSVTDKVFGNLNLPESSLTFAGTESFGDTTVKRYLYAKYSLDNNSVSETEIVSKEDVGKPVSYVVMDNPTKIAEIWLYLCKVDISNRPGPSYEPSYSSTETLNTETTIPALRTTDGNFTLA